MIVQLDPGWADDATPKHWCVCHPLEASVDSTQRSVKSKLTDLDGLTFNHV